MALLMVITRPVLAEQLSFELKSYQGQSVVVAPRESPRQLTVVCFLGTECPLARLYAGRLNALVEEYAQRNVDFVGVMSNRQDSLEDVRHYAETTESTFELLLDPENRVADRYGATRTPEVFLLDGDLKLRYRGRIDDQYAPGTSRAKASRQDLKVAIDELLAGKVVSIKETKALGCVIGKIKQVPSPGNQDTSDRDTANGRPGITFTEHVFPLLQTHCIDCHRAGEIGPFAMDQYDEVVGWADTMLETIEEGRMPPWHADPRYGSFANERSMSEEDQELFRRWIQAGAPEGPPVATTPREYVRGWQLEREPDLVIPMRDRPFMVPRDGVVEYQYFVVDPGFTEDKWVSGAQVVPGSHDVVHHAIVFVRPPDGARFRGVGWLTAYVPGQRVQQLPPGHARLIPAGSKLVFQMHYTPSGTQRQDVTQVGVVFADEADVTHNVYTLMALEQDFEIPPGAPDHHVTAQLSFLPRQAELLAATPHMHYRGKSFQLIGQQQDGVSRDAATENGAPNDQQLDQSNETILLSVPNYDFNWQHTYQFSRSIPLDSLASLRFDATFDNSSENPFNPDPEQWVTWGDQTWEEMAVAFFEVSIPRQPNNQSLASSARAATESDASAEQQARRSRLIDNYVSRVFEKMDGNNDGVIHRAEASIIVRRWNFWRWDLDEDGRATRDEVRQVAEELF